MASIKDLGQQSMKKLSMKVGSFDLRAMYDKKGGGDLELSLDEYNKLDAKGHERESAKIYKYSRVSPKGTETSLGQRASSR